MNALEKFKKLLETATPAARELVQAYHRAMLAWDMQEETNPKAVLDSAPPAKEPVSAEGVVSEMIGPRPMHWLILPHDEFPVGRRVKVTLLES